MTVKSQESLPRISMDVTRKGHQVPSSSPAPPKSVSIIGSRESQRSKPLELTAHLPRRREWQEKIK